MATQDDYIRVTLRIPKDLHSQLADAAEETSKSMNAEIIARLNGSFGSQDSAIERGRRIEKLKGKVDPQLESLLSSFVSQIELEIQRQAQELAEDRAKKE